MKTEKTRIEEILNIENPNELTPFGDDIIKGMSKHQWRFIAIVEHPESWEGAEYRGFPNKDCMISEMESYKETGWNILGLYEII